MDIMDLHKTIKEDINFCDINLAIRQGVINESYIIDSLCNDDKLKKHITYAILYLEVKDKKQLVKALEKVIDDDDSIRLFIGTLEKKGMPYGITYEDLKAINNLIINSNSEEKSYNLYLYAYCLKNLNISTNEKKELIKEISNGITNTHLIRHIINFISEIINTFNFNKEERVEIINNMIDNIIDSLDIKAIGEFLQYFSLPFENIFYDIDKIRVYERMALLAIKEDDLKLMVNVSYYNITTDTLYTLAYKILAKDNVKYALYFYESNDQKLSEEIQDLYLEYFKNSQIDDLNIKEEVDKVIKIAPLKRARPFAKIS